MGAQQRQSLTRGVKVRIALNLKHKLRPMLRVCPGNDAAIEMASDCDDLLPEEGCVTQ